MFLKKITSSDPRFKTIEFRDGLNILVAERTNESTQKDSRNSVGKTSLIKVLRYVLGENRPEEFRDPQFATHEFTAIMSLPSLHPGVSDEVAVSRPVSPSTRIRVSGWSIISENTTEISVKKWRKLLSQFVFHVPKDVNRPTSRQLWGQLIRTYFGNPTKIHQTESSWEAGVRIGFLLGLSPLLLNKTGQLIRLRKHKDNIRKAALEGVWGYLTLDEPVLRSKLASARAKRDQTKESLRSFKIDKNYAIHQIEADRLSKLIQQLNDEELATRQRLRELNEAIEDNASDFDENAAVQRIVKVYEEIGIIFPEKVVKRYEEVKEFHDSLIRNRQSFLEQELAVSLTRLKEVANKRSSLDRQRAHLLGLLKESIAFDTFLEMQHQLAEDESSVSKLEQQLELIASMADLDGSIQLKANELVALVRTELREKEGAIDQALSLFEELGRNIYSGRDASLRISVSPDGILTVKPYISKDSGTGVQNVELFMLDIVCLVSALNLNNAPGLLVHDSTLFDAIDGRQVASCLNVGAHLAQYKGFQYIVTLNSDFLSTVQSQCSGFFDAQPYILEQRFTDRDQTGGLFGFQFG